MLFKEPREHVWDVARRITVNAFAILSFGGGCNSVVFHIVAAWIGFIRILQNAYSVKRHAHIERLARRVERNSIDKIVCAIARINGVCSGNTLCHQFAGIRSAVAKSGLTDVLHIVPQPLVFLKIEIDFVRLCRGHRDFGDGDLVGIRKPRKRSTHHNNGGHHYQKRNHD